MPTNTDPECVDCNDPADVTSPDGESRCDCCHGDAYAPCNCCGETCTRDELRTRSGESLCGSCYEDRHIPCDCCGDSTYYDDVRHVSSAILCESCADHMCLCGACGTVFDPECGGEYSENVGDYRCDDCIEDSIGGYGVPYRNADPESVPMVPDGRTFGVEIEAQMECHPYDWEAVEDGSLDSCSGEYECVSPVLSGAIGMQRLYGAVGAIDGEACDNGGVHVHVGASDLTGRELRNVLRGWECYGEDMIAGLVPGRRFDDDDDDDNGWAVSVKDGLLSRTYDRAGVDDDDAIGYLDLRTGTRYLSCNVASLRRHGTLEFRAFPSCVEANVIAGWAAFVVRFVHLGRDLDPERMRAMCNRRGFLRVAARVFARWCPYLSEFIRNQYDDMRREGLLSAAHETCAAKAWDGDIKTQRREQTAG